MIYDAACLNSCPSHSASKQICDSSRLLANKAFSLRAPAQPGLYMIWGKCSYHYSFVQAEIDQWPRDYSGAAAWYDGFISWLRVDANTARAKAGTAAAFWGKPDINEAFVASGLRGA